MISKEKIPVIAAPGAFAIGLALGYLTLAPPPAGPVSGSAVPETRTRASGHSANDTAADLSRTTRPREKKLPLRIDAEGNYLLPPAMADRLECLVLNGTKVNPVDLRILGLDDSQIGRVQQLADDAFQRFFERKRAAMREFTMSDDELVWEIPGDEPGALADEQRIIDGVQAICGAKAALVSDRLVSQIKGATSQLGSGDYFLRISKAGGSGNNLAFENLVIYPDPTGGERPAPGQSFMDYKKRWRYGSSGRNGGTVPPDTVMPLVHDKDWQRLQPRKP